jgi:uncharacterized protein YPO0396
MNQNDYNTIVSCINHGAPAIATRLLTGLNQVMQGSNEYNKIVKAQQESAKKAEVEKQEAKTAIQPAGKPVAKKTN